MATEYSWPITLCEHDVATVGITVALQEALTKGEYAALYEQVIAGKFGEIEPYVPPPEPDPQEVAAKEARSRRDALLTASDWTQVADAPVDQAAWVTYRQALRDVPQQAGFPESVMWPVKPES